MKSRVILFITGASVMILQIMGVRIIATELGTSVGVWSSIIAVTIASLAVGYYAGGVFADKKTCEKDRAVFVGAAGLAVLLIVPFKSVVFLFGSPLPYGVQATLVSLVLFSIPTILLAITTIYSTRMELSTVSKVSSTSGTLYAVSTLGSLFGVFFTSFYLIPTFGVFTIIYSLAALLLVTGVVAKVTS